MLLKTCLGYSDRYFGHFKAILFFNWSIPLSSPLIYLSFSFSCPSSYAPGHLMYTVVPVPAGVFLQSTATVAVPVLLLVTANLILSIRAVWWWEW